MLAPKNATDDYNTMIDYGIYAIENSHQKSNTPYTDANHRHGFMIVYGWSGANRPIQLLVLGESDGISISVRSWVPSGFTSWRKVSFS